MTLQERLRQEAELCWHGQRACLPGLLHEAAAKLDELDAELQRRREADRFLDREG